MNESDLECEVCGDENVERCGNRWLCEVCSDRLGIAPNEINVDDDPEGDK